MNLEPILTAIHDWSVSDAIRQSEYAFPALESIHVFAITTVVGFISIVDLRLLGVPAHTRNVKSLLGQLLPVVWGAFALAAVSGGLMFASNATGYAKNFDFQAKMLLMLLAFCNMVVFHFMGQRRIAEWVAVGPTPAIAKFSGGLSLLLWIGVVGFGRWIGFTLAPF